MKVTIRLAFGLALFLATVGTVYAVTAREYLGAVLILVCAVAALYIGLSFRSADRRAAHPTDLGAPGEEGAGEPEEPEEVEQTIWPFVLSIAALLGVVGAVGLRWVLIPSAIVFAGAGAGWFVEIQRQRIHSNPREAISTLEGHEQPDDHHGS